ncbi:hypothetical protein L1987_14924 [Smallanthus sonchifolius]|uniref:Uncharacterized protein n=1 Tax=Smallanthus sonchifolius TaxID=185202 RepID=A0ACB9J7M8_9ASTR|nr:hypothetical protein L1987_14924 [Smallanthus sonchifolius]
MHFVSVSHSYICSLFNHVFHLYFSINSIVLASFVPIDFLIDFISLFVLFGAFQVIKLQVHVTLSASSSHQVCCSSSEHSQVQIEYDVQALKELKVLLKFWLKISRTILLFKFFQLSSGRKFYGRKFWFRPFQVLKPTFWISFSFVLAASYVQDYQVLKLQLEAPPTYGGCWSVFELPVGSTVKVSAGLGDCLGLVTGFLVWSTKKIVEMVALI